GERRQADSATARRGEVEARRLAAGRLGRRFRTGDREQRLKHVRRAPPVAARGELSQTLGTQRGDKGGRDVIPDAGRTAIQESDVSMPVEEREGGRVRVTAREVDAKCLPERGHLFTSPGRELPGRANPVPVLRQDGGRIHVWIGRDLGQRL